MLLDSVLSPWGAFQLAALVAGMWLMGAAWRVPFVVGSLTAAFGAVALPALLRVPRVMAGAPFRFEVMSFGALAGMALGVALVARQRAVALDRLAPALGAMVALARCGCLVSGCDFGRVTVLPWGLTFPPGSPAALQHARWGWVADGAASLPVHPTQLYEVLLGLVMLWVARRVPGGRGDAFAASVASYAVGRLLIELVRADEGRGFVAGFSLPQLLCVAVLAACAAHVLRDESHDGVKVSTR